MSSRYISRPLRDSDPIGPSRDHRHRDFLDVLPPQLGPNGHFLTNLPRQADHPSGHRNIISALQNLSSGRPADYERPAFSHYRPSDPFALETPYNPVKISLATAGLKSLFERINRKSQFKEGVHLQKGKHCYSLIKALLQPPQGEPWPADAHLGSALLHKRYLVELKPSSVLSKDGLTCWVVSGQDIFNDNQPIALKIYKEEFSGVLAQELDTNRRLTRNDPFRWASLMETRDTFQFGEKNTFHCAVMELLDPKPLFNHPTFERMKELRYDVDTPYRVRATAIRQTIDDLRKITFEVLKTLGYLKWQRTIHADLKPENILLSVEENNKIAAVKLIDFGNAIQDCLEEKKLYFGDFQLQAILYRAPEIYFGMENFSYPIDMWSVGCILAELYIGHPLFAYDDEEEILNEMKRILGSFPRDIFRKGLRYKEWKIYARDEQFSSARQLFNLQKELNTLDFHFVDFIHKCLVIDPKLRLDPEEALRHPFLAPTLAFGYFRSPRNGEPRSDWCPFYSRQILEMEFRDNPIPIEFDRERALQRSLARLKTPHPSPHTMPLQINALHCQRFKTRFPDVTNHAFTTSHVPGAHSLNSRSDSSASHDDFDSEKENVAALEAPIVVEGYEKPTDEVIDQCRQSKTCLLTRKDQISPENTSMDMNDYVNLDLSRDLENVEGRQIKNDSRDIDNFTITDDNGDRSCSAKDDLFYSKENNLDFESPNDSNQENVIGCSIGADHCEDDINVNFEDPSCNDRSDPRRTVNIRQNEEVYPDYKDCLRLSEYLEAEQTAVKDLTPEIEPELNLLENRDVADREADSRKVEENLAKEEVLMPKNDDNAERKNVQPNRNSNRNCNQRDPIKSNLIRHLEMVLDHRHRVLFERKIKDKEAPNYSKIVKIPVDVNTIKSKIRTGILPSFETVKREILLMFVNSLMYNDRGSAIYEATQEIFSYAITQSSELELSLNKIKEASEKPETFTTPIRKKRISSVAFSPSSTPHKNFFRAAKKIKLDKCQ